MCLENTHAVHRSQGCQQRAQQTSGSSNFPFLRMSYKTGVNRVAGASAATFCYLLCISSSSSILFCFTPLIELILHACTQAAVVWAEEKLLINILSHVLAGQGRRSVACCAVIP